jgi:phosphate-selective porin OprO/OprP
VARYVHSPFKFLRSKAVHVGGSVSYRINAQQNQTEFKSRPEIGVVDDYYVNTGVIEGANKVLRLGLEASSVMGRFSWQAEALSARVERSDFQKVTFRGAYTFFSWFLTDDSRNYDAGSGLFLPVTPRNPLFKGGLGAFEIAARISYVDLTDQDIIGGQETNISLGFNWYLNEQFRVMTNLIKVLDVKRPGSEYDGLDPLILAIRLQWVM